MNLDRFVLKSLLQVDDPWTVQDYRFEPRKRRLEVWIGTAPPRSWFGFASRNGSRPATEQVWRHVDLANWRTTVTVAVPEGADVSGAPWTGDPGAPFTRTLAKRVFDLLNEGLSLRSICSVLDLPLDQVWKYRYALDSGKTRILREEEAAPAPDAPRAAAEAVLAEEGAAGGQVPDLTDPCWLRLIEGELPLDIRVLSLRLMLTRVSSQLEVISDEEVRMLKLRELHRYFVKNERMLGHELAQLRAA